MSNVYKPLTEYAEVLYGPGTGERDLSAVQEKDALDGGHLEIVPRKYKVLSTNYAAGKQGVVVDLTLLSEIEAALISGGHLERVESEPPAPKAKPTK